MPHPNSEFMADGEERFKRSPAYRASVAAIERQVELEFRGRIFAAGLFGRVLIGLAVRREVRRRVRALLPEDALYGASKN